jgi:hypothetical protein
MYIELYRLEQNIKKKTRASSVVSAGTFGSSTNMGEGKILFSAHKYGTSSFLIEITNPMLVGEYGFTVKGIGVFNLFGID